MYDEAPFGRWLRQRRRTRDLTQADLARRVGCSEITIRKFEADERTPSRQIAELLADCLDVPASQRPAFVAFARGRQCGDDLAPPEPAPARNPCALPVPLTRLLGREQDAALVRRTLLRDDVRMLTLVGPPGIGKTRLSLHVAADLCADGRAGPFPHGVAFVSLASIGDPGLVLSAIAQALGVTEATGQALRERLVEALREQALLLILDNFEHLLAAAPDVAWLLMACSRLKTLVTSRAALHIRGEHLLPVAPLALPDMAWPLSAEAVARSPAAMLFVERAQAVAPHFALTSENAAVVAAICARLDGLPLAIELVAARSRLLSPLALLSRLGQRLSFLAAGPGDLPPRHQTLRAAIEWSYELLASAEQVALARLGVFVGGFCAEAAEALCADCRLQIADCRLTKPDQSAIYNLQSTILDVLASLVNQSLLQAELRDDGTTRFTMLETLREYALEKLNQSGEQAAVRQRHAAYYGALAAATARKSNSAEQEQWIDRIQVDINNIRAALDWYAERDPEAGLRCAAALRQFWLARGHLGEGRAWLARGNACVLSRETRALALSAAGFLAHHQGDNQQAESLTSESLALYRQLGDARGIAEALLNLSSVALFQSCFVRAEALASESLALYRQLGNARGIAEALRVLALIAKDRGDFPHAARLGDECLILHRQLGDRRGMARTIYNLSTIAYWQGEYARSKALAEQAACIFADLGDHMGLAYALEGIGMVAYKQDDYGEARQTLARSLDLFRALEEKFGMALVLHEIGLVMHAQGEIAQAIQFHRDGLVLSWQISDRRRAAFCLEGLAAAIGADRPLDAARLFGSAEALRESLGTPIPPSERAHYDRSVASARAGVDATTFTAAWAAGRALPVAQVLDEVVGDQVLTP